MLTKKIPISMFFIFSLFKSCFICSSPHIKINRHPNNDNGKCDKNIPEKPITNMGKNFLLFIKFSKLNNIKGKNKKVNTSLKAERVTILLILYGINKNIMLLNRAILFFLLNTNDNLNITNADKNEIMKYISARVSLTLKPIFLTKRCR